MYKSYKNIAFCDTPNLYSKLTETNFPIGSGNLPLHFQRNETIFPQNRSISLTRRKVRTMPSTTESKHRLVFLTVNSSFSHSSLALPLLHSASQDLPQWEWLRYDMTLKENPISAIQNIFSMKCDLLVTDLYLFNRRVALDLLQRYHALAPSCRIAAGGPECLGDGASELLRQYPWLDHVFRGEGELLFREYLEHFDDPIRPETKISPAEGNAVFREWDTSATPAEDPFFITDKPFAQIETSRGCPMKCFYCTSGGTLPRYRSLEQVREELQLLKSKGVKELRLLDRTFNLPQDRGAALLKMFRVEFPEMKFHLELHPQFLNGTLREELKQALPGQLHVEVGIQCLDQKVQNLSGRRSSTPEVLDGLKFLCSLTAFETHADLLSGLPGQTWDHILSDASALMEVGVSEIQLEVLKALPGTPLREIAPEYGLRYSAETPYDIMMTNTISLDEMQFARDLSRLLDMTYNHKYLHSVLLLMRENLPSVVPDLLAFFHRSGGDSSVLWDLKKRFLFLLDFCREHQLETVFPELSYQWLLAGFLPEQGADLCSRKSSGIPADAELCAGTTKCLGAKETRYCTLAMTDKIYHLAYNRSCSLNAPAGIWITKR